MSNVFNCLKTLASGRRPLLFAASLAVGALFAAPVTEEEAKLAATAWVAQGDLCGAKARGRATAAVRHEVGKSAYYAVKLDAGMVFTSGDTECDPIVAVTSADEFDDDPRNPLVKLLKRDAEIRARIAADQAAQTAAPGSVPGGTPLLKAGAPSPAGSSAKWAELLAEGERLETQMKNGGLLLNAAPQTSIGDVRVAPILTTKWSQLTHNDDYPASLGSRWSGKNCYNYYTPAVTFYYYTSATTIAVPGGTMNAYCGCSATALAQLLKRWEYPSSQSSGTFQCIVVDIRPSSTGGMERYGKYKDLSLMTGSYAWSSMVNVPKTSWTDAAAQAIGKLTYNCAVALESEFSAEGTGASPAQQTLALKNAFGYKSAQYYWAKPGFSNSETLHRRALYASLDAGAPVLLAIYEYDAASGNTYGGHCVVGDGYGYAAVGGSKLPFVHLNMGWSGSDDVWYNLPNVNTAGAGYDNGNYNAFWGVIYNVFPDKTGEVVSGRVLASGGSPVSGATVTVKRSGSSSVLQTATSSSSGVYAFILPSGSRYEITATAPGGASGSVTTTSVPASGSQIGNSWGNDIVVAQSVDLAVDVAFLSLGRGMYDEVLKCDRYEVGQPIISHTYLANHGAGTAVAPIRELHEVLKSGSSTVLRTFTYDSGADIEGGHGSYWETGLYSDFLQNLSPGSYVYRVTVDPNGTVPDADRSNNVKTFAFTVVEGTPDLDRIEIDGPTALRPGERAAYACTAHYSNGALRDLDPSAVLWTISANGSHATVDPQTGVVTAGVDATPHTVTLRASYAEGGRTVQDYLTVSIGSALSLPVALDNADLVFTTDGAAPWFGQTEVHPADDPDAARSGVIRNYESSTMRTTVTGRGTLSFDYLVSSEANYDWFEFACDGVRGLRVSGTNNVWRQHSVTVGAGTHQFVWSYAKDVSLDRGLDAAYVGNVRWTELVTPSGIAIDAEDLAPIVAGESRQLRATVRMSDGSSRTVTDAATWSVTTNDCATITAGGLLRTFASIEDGDVTVVVSYAENGVRQETSARIVITGRLPEPFGPTITRATGDAEEVILEWTPVWMAESFVVLRRPASAPAGTEQPIAGGIAGTIYHDATVEPGVDYAYSVEAVNVSGRAKGGSATAHRMVSLVFQGSVGTLPPEGGTASLTVKSNARWAATAAADWVALVAASGGNGDRLRLTAAANELHAMRSTSVTVVAGAGTDHPTTLSFGVVQAPAAIVEPEKCNYAFAKLADGDPVETAYATSTDSGSAERILRSGSSFRVRFGWANVGKGEGVHDVVNAVRLADVDGAVASAHTLIVPGPIATNALQSSLLRGGDWSSLPSGPYALTVTLNAGNTEVETNPDDNETTWRFALRDPLTLEAALGAGFAFETEGDDWFGSKQIGPNGGNGAMTRHLGDGGTNVLRGAAAGAGTLTFDYRVSSEARDRFAFCADGGRVFTEGGAGAWRTKTVTFEDEGDHAFEWRYEKDATLSERGDCAFLANVTWTPRFDETAPTNVVASEGNSSWINVTWDPVPGAASYTVARAESAEGPFEVIRRKLTTCSLYDSGVMGGVRYWYRVQAVFATRVSGWSEADDGYRRHSLAATGTSRDVPGSAGQSVFDLYASCRWTAEVTGGDWLKLDTGSGEGNAKVVFSYDKNTTGAERTGRIAVTSVNTAGTPTTVNITITQKVPADLGTEVSLNEAADCDLRFVLTGDAKWVGQTRVSHDGKSALRSGEVCNGGVSSVSTVFTTAGRLTFWWGACCWHSTDFLKLYVSGECVATITGCADGTAVSDYKKKNVKWEQQTIDIPAGGAVVEWRFNKGTTGSFGEDAAFVDQIVWTPATPAVEETDSWWRAYGEELMIRFATTDRDEIMRKPSPGTGGTRGKSKADGTSVLVWEDFVAGTDPFDSDSVFTTLIEMVDGRPVVRWEPELTADDAARRHYQTFGRSDLERGSWEPVPDGREADYNFFRVTVEMR